MKTFVVLVLVALSFDVFACEPAPAPVINLDANKFYKDKQNSVVDPELKAKHDAAVLPLEQFIKQVANQSDQYALDPIKNKAQGQCTADWIYSWAKNGALLGEMKTEQSFYERKWMLAGLALVYAKVKNAAPDENRTTIETWLSRLADLTIEHSAAYKGARNNHYYWEGLAVGAVGKITTNKKDLDWATNVFETGMNDISNEGTLPKEMARGQRALHYHLFSAAPLVLLSSILDRSSPKLKLLVNFIVKSSQDPAEITKLSGAVPEKEADADYAWLNVYLRKYPDPQIAKFLTSKKQPRYSKLGGNLSLPNPLESAVH